MLNVRCARYSDGDPRKRIAGQRAFTGVVSPYHDSMVIANSRFFLTGSEISYSLDRDLVLCCDDYQRL